jgi:hypothetical protein
MKCVEAGVSGADTESIRAWYNEEVTKLAEERTVVMLQNTDGLLELARILCAINIPYVLHGCETMAAARLANVEVVWGHRLENVEHNVQGMIPDHVLQELYNTNMGIRVMLFHSGRPEGSNLRATRYMEILDRGLGLGTLIQATGRMNRMTTLTILDKEINLYALVGEEQADALREALVAHKTSRPDALGASRLG